MSNYEAYVMRNIYRQINTEKVAWPSKIFAEEVKFWTGALKDESNFRGKRKAAKILGRDTGISNVAEKQMIGRVYVWVHV